MRPQQIRDLTLSHGGLVQVVTRESARNKWVNTLVCADGFRRTISKTEESAFLRSDLDWGVDWYIEHVVEEG